jgi:hypothetical protein
MKIMAVVLLTAVLVALSAGTILAQGPGNVPPPAGAPQGWWIYKSIPSTQWDRAYESWLNSNGWERYDVDWRTINGVLTQVFRYRKWQAAPTSAALGLIPRYTIERYSPCWSQPGTVLTPQGCAPASRWY